METDSQPAETLESDAMKRLVTSFAQGLWRCRPHHWLRRAQGREIALATGQLLPPPYDPGMILFSERETEPGFLLRQERLPDIKEYRKIEEIVAPRLLEWRANLIAAGFSGAAVGMDFVAAYATVDENLLKAAGDLFNERITAISDLTSRLDGLEASAGLTASLKGRMAEHVLAERLAELGVPVALAEKFNQEGWDLHVDGVPVNPKLYADAAHTGEHFGRFPDIPVILPADAANIPADALTFDSLTGAGLDDVRAALGTQVDQLSLVDSALSHAEITAQTGEAVDVLLDPTNVAGPHLPWVVLALSGYREFRLLTRRMTTFRTSLVHLGLDVSGTGGGAWLGAKAGSLAGTPLGPLGIAGGGTVGAFIGAILGRKLSGRIKQQPLREALERLDQVKLALQTAAEIADQDMKRQLEQEGEGLRRGMQHNAVSARESMSALIARHIDAERVKGVMQAEEAARVTGEALKALSYLRLDLNRRHGERSIWRRWIWPDIATLALEQGIETIDAATSRITQWQDGLNAGRPLNRSELYGLLGVLGILAEEVKGSIRRMEEARRQSIHDRLTLHQNLLADLLAARTKAMEQYQHAVAAALETARGQLAESLAALTNAMTEVEQAKAKLG